MYFSFAVEEYGTSCSFVYLTSDPYIQSYVLSLFIGGFAVPLIVLCICYVLIFTFVARHEQDMCKISGDSEERRSIRACPAKSPKVEIQIAKVSIVIVVAFCIAWLPFAIVTLMGVFGYSRLITVHVQMLPAMFAKVSPLYNPIIYGTGHPVVRRALRNACRGRKPYEYGLPTTHRGRLSSTSSLPPVGKFSRASCGEERKLSQVHEEVLLKNYATSGGKCQTVNPAEITVLLKPDEVIL